MALDGLRFKVDSWRKVLGVVGYESRIVAGLCDTKIPNSAC